MPFLEISRTYCLPYAASHSSLTWLTRMTLPRSIWIQALSAKSLAHRVAGLLSKAPLAGVPAFSTPEVVTAAGLAAKASAARSVFHAAAARTAGGCGGAATASGAASASRARVVVASKDVRGGIVDSVGDTGEWSDVRTGVLPRVVRAVPWPCLRADGPDAAPAW